MSRSPSLFPQAIRNGGAGVPPRDDSVLLRHGRRRSQAFNLPSRLPTPVQYPAPKPDGCAEQAPAGGQPQPCSYISTPGCWRRPIAVDPAT